MLLISSFYFLR